MTKLPYTLSKAKGIFFESTSKGLSFATKLVNAALAVQKRQHFQDDGSFLQQKRLAEKNENFSRI